MNNWNLSRFTKLFFVFLSSLVVYTLYASITISSVAEVDVDIDKSNSRMLDGEFVREVDTFKVLEEERLKEEKLEEENRLREEKILQEKVFNEERDSRINEIVEKYSYYDGDGLTLLKSVIEVEKSYGLRPMELVSLLSIENNFRNDSIVEHDGVTSYGMTQMRLCASEWIQPKINELYGKDLPVPSDSLLREDVGYQIELAGGYLRWMRDKYSSEYSGDLLDKVVWGEYNMGMGVRKRFMKENGHIDYSYTKKMVNRVEELSLIIGEYY